MFTGIVRERGRIVEADGGAEGIELVVEAPQTATRSRSTAAVSPRPT
jgi:riboflavin synthase alpha subunit